MLALVGVNGCGRLGYEALAGHGDAAEPMDGLSFDAAEETDTPDGSALHDGRPMSDGPQDDTLTPDDGATANDGGEEDPLLLCEGRRKEWLAEFAADPTKADLNTDGVPDWSPARGSFAATQLKNGHWKPTGAGVLLDTAPQDDFSTRTVLNVQMQHVGLTAGPSNTQEGALAWLNLDNHLPSRIAVYMRLLRTGLKEQTLYLTANADGKAQVLATFTMDESMASLTMAANPKNQKVQLWIEGDYKGKWDLPRSGGPAFGDAFATVGTLNGSAVFDSVRVERCTE